MTFYRSRVDWWIFLLIAAVLILAVVLLVITTLQDGKIVGSVMSLIALFIPAVLIVDLYRNTYYVIDDAERTLLVKGGILVNNKYNIDNVTLVKKTDTWLNYPALSMDRLEIRFGKFSRVVVSPKDKEVFINHLMRINPDCEINI